MLGLIKKYWKKYQIYKLKQAEEIIAGLKVRYHTFRVLLINNEQALKTLNDIDVRLKRKNVSGQEVATQAEELLGTTYELVDGLNRLSGNRHGKLYDLHKQLSDAVRKALPEPSGPDTDGPYCLFLDEIMPDMKPMAGGKAGPLTDLKRLSVPIPDGFVITTYASREFLRANDLERPIRKMLHAVEEKDPLSVNLDGTVAEISRMIESANLTPELERVFRTAYDRLTGGTAPISVRSSAGVEDQSSHSFAGQFKTILNVMTFDDMVKAFKEVLASNFNAGSLIYRFHAGLSLVDFDMAVLCQIIVNEIGRASCRERVS
jgi:pyruvate,water dikinase